MEENLLQKDRKDEIGIPNIKETECTSWNYCGGAVLIGCWFGVFLLPLIHIKKKRLIS